MKRYLKYKVETKQRDYYFFADKSCRQERALFNFLALLKSKKISFDFIVYDCICKEDREIVSNNVLYTESHITG